MTAFTEWPSAFVLARTAVALLAFGFLPGYFIGLGRRREKNFLGLFRKEPVEAVAEGLFISLALVSLAVIALMFSIGFSPLVFALEFLFLAGAFVFWRRFTN